MEETRATNPFLATSVIGQTTRSTSNEFFNSVNLSLGNGTIGPWLFQIPIDTFTKWLFPTRHTNVTFRVEMILTLHWLPVVLFDFGDQQHSPNWFLERSSWRSKSWGPLPPVLQPLHLCRKKYFSLHLHFNLFFYYSCPNCHISELPMSTRMKDFPSTCILIPH